MPDPSSESRTRRGFVGWLAGGLAAVPFLGGAAVALRAAAAKPKIRRPDRVPVCRLEEVPDAGFLERAISYDVRRGPAVDNVAEKVFVTREQGEVVVFSSRCTHLGCPVTLRADVPARPFLCPCHDAEFSAAGEALDGPAEAPLHRYAVFVPDTATGLVEIAPR